jgi:membrane protein DedA with SNARE-associated domain
MSGTLGLLLNEYGAAIVFGIVLLGQLGAPIPAIAVLMAAAALSATEGTPVSTYATAGLAACVVADCAAFAVGRRYGTRVLNALYRIARVPDNTARRAQLAFERFRGGTLIAAKFIPGLSLLAAPLSGASGMRWPPFVLFSSIGSLLWVATGIGLGVLLADEIPVILRHIRELGWGLAAVLVVVVMSLLIHRRYAGHGVALRR